MLEFLDLKSVTLRSCGKGVVSVLSQPCTDQNFMATPHLTRVAAVYAFETRKRKEISSGIYESANCFVHPKKRSHCDAGSTSEADGWSEKFRSVKSSFESKDDDVYTCSNVLTERDTSDVTCQLAQRTMAQSNGIQTRQLAMWEKLTRGAGHDVLPLVDSESEASTPGIYLKLASPGTATSPGFSPTHALKKRLLFLLSLPNNLISIILSKVAATSNCPADLASISLTCCKLYKAAQAPLVLSSLSMAAVTPSAHNWSSPSIYPFLVRCIFAGNYVNAAHVLGMVLWSYVSKRALAQQLFQLAATSSNMRVCEARVPMPFHFKREVQTFEETSRQSTCRFVQKKRWDCGKAPKMPFPLSQVSLPSAPHKNSTYIDRDVEHRGSPPH